MFFRLERADLRAALEILADVAREMPGQGVARQTELLAQRVFRRAARQQKINAHPRGMPTNGALPGVDASARHCALPHTLLPARSHQPRTTPLPAGKTSAKTTWLRVVSMKGSPGRAFSGRCAVVPERGNRLQPFAAETASAS